MAFASIPASATGRIAAEGGGALIGSAIGSTLGTSFGVGLGIGVATFLSPFTELATYELNAMLQQRMADPTTLALQRIRKVLTQDEYLAEMRRHGLNDRRAKDFLKVAKKTLSVEDIIIRLRRGLIKQADAISEADDIGIEEDVFNKILKSSEYIYTPQDLIVFLVRDVFNPTVVEKYQLDEEFPPAATSHFAKIGVSEELARFYWQAHWKLPSVSDSFEMMYRYRKEDKEFWEAEAKANGLKTDQLETNLDEIRDMLKINDVTHFWRERQLGIAFRPLTLRMIQQQVRLRLMDRAKTAYAYRKIGFSNNDAEQNAVFAFLYESLTDWTDLLKDGLITEEDIRKEMSEWKVPKSLQDMIWTRKLEPATEKQAVKEKEIGVTYLKKGFLLQELTREEAIEGLRLLKYAEKTAKFMVEIWILDNEPQVRKEKNLSAANLAKLFEAGTITETQYELRLTKEVGYTIEAAKELIFLTKLKLAQKAASA